MIKQLGYIQSENYGKIPILDYSDLAVNDVIPIFWYGSFDVKFTGIKTPPSSVSTDIMNTPLLGGGDYYDETVDLSETTGFYILQDSPGIKIGEYTIDVAGSRITYYGVKKIREEAYSMTSIAIGIPNLTKSDVLHWKALRYSPSVTDKDGSYSDVPSGITVYFMPLPSIQDNNIVFPLFNTYSDKYTISKGEVKSNPVQDLYYTYKIARCTVEGKQYSCMVITDKDEDKANPGYIFTNPLLIKPKKFFNFNEDESTFNPTLDDNDPYENDPDSQGNNDPGGHKGGDGKYQDTDEDVPIPGLPGISATDTGLCTLYNPSNAELKELSDYLWSDVFSVESFKKLFADPMDIILGMSIVPLKVSDGERAEIKVGGLSTGVSMNKCKTQYIEVDCGSLDISNYWDNFMDYDPYTHYTLYLPYVGYKVIHADELVDKTITVKYHCDILSGACMAYVQCGKKVLYCFEGNISIQIPVTSASYDNMIHGMLQVASGVGQIIAGGASMAAGGAGAGIMVSGAVGTATGAASAIKPTIGRSGNAESSTGLMGIQKPYLIISRPRAVVPSGLNKYSGYPAYKGGKLGDFNNFTVVQDIRIKNLNGATMEEMNEAERLCKEGVIV